MDSINCHMPKRIEDTTLTGVHSACDFLPNLQRFWKIPGTCASVRNLHTEAYLCQAAVSWRPRILVVFSGHIGTPNHVDYILNLKILASVEHLV